MIEQVYFHNEEGGWSTAHCDFYGSAYAFRAEFQHTLTSLQKSCSRLSTAEKAGEDSPEFSSALNDDIKLRSQAFRQAQSALLFICMSIEAFVNHYGVRKLGEKYYKKNIERLGITEKATLLFYFYRDEQIDHTEPFIKTIRSLFDQRNQLVHPKTREYDQDVKNGKSISINPEDIAVCDMFEQFEFVIDSLCKIDSEIVRDFEFSKTNET